MNEEKTATIKIDIEHSEWFKEQRRITGNPARYQLRAFIDEGIERVEKKSKKEK